MQPLIVAQQVTQGVADFLRMAFLSTTNGFEGLLERLLAERKRMVTSNRLSLQGKARADLSRFDASDAAAYLVCVHAGSCAA